MIEFSRQIGLEDLTSVPRTFEIEANPDECKAPAQRFAILAHHRFKVKGVMRRASKGPVDLAEIAVQYLSMAINSFPRTAGATLDTSALEGVKILSEEADRETRSPFSQLRKYSTGVDAAWNWVIFNARCDQAKAIRVLI